MEHDKRYMSAALSLVALLSTGCPDKTYIQTGVGYAHGHHPKGEGRIDLICIRPRGGMEKNEHEYRFGANICYGELPDSTSQKKIGVDLPVVGNQEADIQGAIKSDVVIIGIPMV